MSRGTNGRGTIFRDKYGSGWIGILDFGTDPTNGKRIRRKRRGRTRAEVQAKLDDLLVMKNRGRVPSTTRLSVSQWLHRWLQDREGQVAPNTWAGYKTDVGYVDTSGLGSVALRNIHVGDIDALYRWLVADDRRNRGTVEHVRGTLNAAFEAAMIAGHLTVNFVPDVALRGTKRRPNRPYSPTEVCTLHEAALAQRNGVRWDLALLGLRRSEVLGLRWSAIDLDNRILYVEQALHWRPWAHGCTSVRGGKHCGRQGRWCPRRHSGGPEFGLLKSESSAREVGIPEAVVEHLRAHRIAQQDARELAGKDWQDWDLVIATPTGTPVSWSTDSRQWREMRAGAGLRPIRVHDLRHTGATTLGRLGVSSRTLTGVMGWSTSRMADTYVRVETDVLLHTADLLNTVLSAGRAADRAATGDVDTAA